MLVGRDRNRSDAERGTAEKREAVGPQSLDVGAQLGSSYFFASLVPLAVNDGYQV